MFNVPTKVDGASTVDSEELNSGFGEQKTIVTDSGQSLNGALVTQSSIAASINAAGATFYVDAGAINAYVLGLHGLASLQSPTAYFEGMLIRWRADTGNTNTGGSTVNVATLGIKTIFMQDGTTALGGGEIRDDNDSIARYSVSANGFLIVPLLSIATKTSKGTAFLGDQRIILSNNVGDQDADIDFSGGRFTFDDGTGQQVAPVFTKQLDAAFVQGTAQGGNVVDTFPGTVQALTIYHCFAINDPSSGNSDYMFDTSVTGANIPAGFTKKRRIGAIRTDSIPNSRAILQFHQIGKEFRYNVRTLALNITTPGTAGVLLTILTPLDIETIAIMNITVATTIGGNSVLVTSPSEADSAPTTLLNTAFMDAIGGASIAQTVEFTVKTDILSQIRYRSSISPVISFIFQCLGYVDESLEG